ncbi:MAG TPA: acyl-CoA dehydrogenase family protein [Anaerolineales bacterium]|nr:acyl-CoA dehydrogenase family protein [Anaerolineales bacterium]
MYSFEPSDEQRMLVDAARRFAVNDLRPAARESDETASLSRSLVDKGWELGILQASIPEAYGGFGDRSAVTGVLATEELAYGDLSTAFAIGAPALFALPLLLAGTEQQKQQYLPKVVGGEWRPYTSALVEYHFDFDPHALRTAAVCEGERYALIGEKAFVPFASEAPAFLIYADLDGQTQGFFVPANTPGLQVAPEREVLMGLRPLPMYRLKLDAVSVSAEDRLGGPAGHDLGPVLASMQVAQAAAAVGVARAAFEYARDYAKEREAFGVKIAQKQAVAFMLAEMCTEIEAIRLLAWEAAWKLDTGNADAFTGAYLAATGATDMAMMVTDRAVQILGGHGYIREHSVEMWMRHGRGFSAFNGFAIV